MSPERFVRDIANGDCCFICGVSPDKAQFNDEHVIPEWLLRRFDLFDKFITLPNGAAQRYDQYKVPCCRDCNSKMGREIEERISAATVNGAEGLVQFVSKDGSFELLRWMSLVFLKTHLRDRDIHHHLDRRKGETRIGDVYDWMPLYHAHALARTFHTGVRVHPNAVGSLLIIHAQDHGADDQYDYGDLYSPQAMFVRFGDVAVVAVLNDSNGVLSIFSEQRLDRITGPVSALQLREIMVDFAFLNLHIKNRPEFRTRVDLKEKELSIEGFRPVLELGDQDLTIRGKLLYHAVKPYIPGIRISGATQEEIEAAIQAGRFSFLFDDQGEFIRDSMRRRDD